MGRGPDKDLDTNQRVVMFIHGAWVTPLCWRYFEPHFRQRGFRTILPAWPLKDRPVDDQLAHPDPRLADIGIPEIVEHHKAVIRRQAHAPLLIGHSFGGLIVQILLDQGFGAAGIAISSVPPRGVSSVRFFLQKPVKKLRSLFGVPFSWRKALPPPQPDEVEQALRKAQGIQTHFVPESARIFWQLFGRAARVNFQNHGRPPLLLVACGQDLAFPAKTYRLNYEMYRASNAPTDFVSFPDLTHFSIAEPGHEALAERCAAWADARFTERQSRAAAEARKNPSATGR